MPPGWSGSVLRIGVSRGLKRSRLRQPSSLDLAALGWVVAALLLVDLAALGPHLNLLPRTPSGLTVKGSLRSEGGVYPRCARPPSALDCEPVRRGCVWEAVRRPRTGHQTRLWESESPPASAPASGGLPPAVEWAQIRVDGDPGGRARQRGHRPLDLDSPLGRRAALREWNLERSAPPACCETHQGGRFAALGTSQTTDQKSSCGSAQ